MTLMLICEGNSPDLVARGHSWGAPFVRTFAALNAEIDCRMVHPYTEPIPAALLEEADGIVFTGAGVQWSVDAAEAAPQRASFEQALEAGKPIWGSCNGMQLAAVMLGGSVRCSPNGLESGFAHDLERVAQEHPMVSGRKSGDGVLCIHRDEVGHLPDGAELVVSNSHSPVQGFAYERGGVRFWGTQYHPELTPSALAGYLRGGGIFQGFEHLTEDLDAISADPESANRLGGRPEFLLQERRAAELIAWVALVERREPFHTAA